MIGCQDAARLTGAARRKKFQGGTHDELVGRRVGTEVVQEGTRADGTLIRWVFSDIKPDACIWRGEASTDAGKTWRLEAEFRLRRILP